MMHVRDVRMLVDRRVVNVDVCMLTDMRTGEYLVYGRRWLPGLVYSSSLTRRRRSPHSRRWARRR